MTRSPADDRLTASGWAADGTLYGPEEAITDEQAVSAYTTGAATAVGVDDTAGSITIGKQADLVILSHNPLDVDPSLIGSIQVLRTYVAVQIRHR